VGHPGQAGGDQRRLAAREHEAIHVPAAEAERERRARIITADGEYQASKRLAMAANVMARDPAALQLRLLQTVAEVASERNSALIMPVPGGLLRIFDKMTPAGPGAELSPSLADFGDAEVAKAEAAIEGRPSAENALPSRHRPPPGTSDHHARAVDLNGDAGSAIQAAMPTAFLPVTAGRQTSAAIEWPAVRHEPCQ
jgi:hypothetical protein